MGAAYSRRRAARNATLPEIIAAAEKILGEPWATFRDRHAHPGRNTVLHAARRLTNVTLAQLAQATGLSSDRAVWIAIQRHTAALPKNKKQRAQTARLLKKWNVQL